LLGGDIAHGPRNERAAAQSTYSGVESPNTHFQSREEICNSQTFGVVEMNRQAINPNYGSHCFDCPLDVVRLSHTSGVR
jgi:hypothetical protein